jgi:hypothetical protein
LLDVTRAITSNLNLSEVFESIVRKVPEVVAVDAATLRLLDPSGKNLDMLSAAPNPDIPKGLKDTLWVK